MSTHSSILAWKIPGMGEPGGLPSMGSHRVTDGQKVPFPAGLLRPDALSCLENPRDGGAWWAAIYGVAQSWMRLKRLSSSSSSTHHLSPEAFEFCFTATMPCGYFEGKKIAGKNQSVCFGNSS